ncbi:MAG: hypothetical protein LUC86_08525 [Prevotellaceae bacterium]|nr:hypothetical protein [Prevotellaceae bacterium]
MMKRLSMFVALACLGLVVPMCVQADDQYVTDANGTMYKVVGDNLVTNGDFSDGLNNWLGGDGNALSTDDFEVSTEEDATTGTNYIKATVGGGGSNSAASIVTLWSIDASKTYYFSCWTKNGGNDTETFLINDNNSSSGGNENHILTVGDNSGAWVQSTIVFKASDYATGDYANAVYTYAGLRLAYLSATSGSEFELSNVVMYEVEEVPADFTYLNNALEDAKTLELTSETAYTDGVSVSEKTDATQSEIDEATEALAKLIQANGTASGELVVYGGKEYKKTGINLIANPDFSYGYTCWTDGEGNAINTTDFTIASDVDVNGTKSYVLKSNGNGGSGSEYSLVTAYAIDNAKTYSFSCDILNGGDNDSFAVNTQANSSDEDKDNGKVCVHLLTFNTGTADEWTHYNLVFSAADTGDAYEYAVVRCSYLGTGYVQMTNFELCEVEVVEEENVDETSVIVNPKFELTNADGNYDAQGWTTTTDENGNAQFSIGPDATYTNGDANVTYPFFEAYGGTTKTPISDRSFYQTIKLEAGEYRLTVDAIATQQDEAFDNAGGVYVYAGDQQTPVYTANGVPETFSVDFTVEAEEDETADVEIGVKLVSCDANWVAFDNFTLTYLGDEKVYDLTTLTELIAEATELYGDGEGTGADDLQAAIEAAQAVLDNSESDNETLVSAISSLKEAMEVYKLQNEQADILGEWVGYTGTFNNIVLEFYREDDTTAHTTAVGTVLTQTITELPAGTYEVQLYFAANYANYGTSDPAGGTQDETEAVAIVANGLEKVLTFGTKSSGDYSSLDDIPVVTLSNVVVDESGTISLSINVTAEQCVNWILVGTKSVTYVSSDVPTYEDLQEAIEAAEALVANVGDEAFQIPAENAEELLSAIETAGEVTEDATASQISAALAPLTSASEEFEAGLSTFVLNTPKEGQTFHIVMEATTTAVPGKALKFIADETNTQGGYDFQFAAEPNANLADQVFTFTADEEYEGVNGYKVSFVTSEGNTLYFCTGNPYGAATGEYGIRATGGENDGTEVTEEDALTIQVIPTTTEGVWQLLNTKVTNGYLGINPNGDETNSLYTNDQDTYCDLGLQCADTVEWTLQADYGTLVLPFAPTEVDGLTFYSTEAYDADSETGAALQLEEVETPEAGVPYIVGGTQGTYKFAVTQRTFSSVSEAAGWLTGAYESTNVPTGSYVLQTGDDGLAFYTVSDDDPITLTPNHCYLTVTSDETDAPAVIFFPSEGGSATAITSVEANVADAEAVYDLSGRKVSQAQKGIYIKGGKKVVIK